MMKRDDYAPFQSRLSHPALSHSALSLFILLLFFLGAHPVRADAVDIPRTEYVLGEKIVFAVNASEGSRLEVVHGDSAFRFIGDPSGEQSFTPTDTGFYQFVLLKDAEAVVTANVFVYGSLEEARHANKTIWLEEDAYLVGTPVVVHLRPAGQFQLTIRTGGQYFTYLGNASENVTFTPQDPGGYIIDYADEESGESYHAFFQAVEKSGKEETPSSTEFGSVLPRVVDRRGERVLAVTRFYPPGEKSPVKGFVFSGDTILFQSFVPPLSPRDLVPGETYDAEIEGNAGVIRMQGLIYSPDEVLGIDDLSSDIRLKGKRVFSAARIDASSLSFTNASLSRVAQGTAVLVCGDWQEMDVHGGCTAWRTALSTSPGESYTLPLQGKEVVFAEVGVATVNTDKPVYHPGETARIIMAVLDAQGYRVENASVNLTVQDPSGRAAAFLTGDGTIINASAGIYVADFTTGEAGEYLMYITAVADQTNASMTSSFFVNASYPYDIIRAVPVTTDPWRENVVSSIFIRSYWSEQPYSLTEYVPRSFDIVSDGGARVETAGDLTSLTWTGLVNGSNVSYTLRPPLITPALYSFGPANVTSGEGSYFEARPWYLAVDPQVTNVKAFDIRMTPLDNRTFVMAWAEVGGTNPVRFKVYDTNGTVLVSTTDVDITGNESSRISVDSFNTTHFVYLYADGPSGPMNHVIYTRSGTTMLALSQISANIGAVVDVSAAVMGTRYATCDANNPNKRAEYYIRNSADGSSAVARTTEATTINQDMLQANLIRCAAINTTAFVYAYFNDNNNRIITHVRSNAGTSGPTINQDLAAGDAAEVAVVGMGSSRFATVWYNSATPAVVFRIHQVNSSALWQIVSVTLDALPGADSRVAIAQVSASNNIYALAAWRNGNSIKGAVYDVNGNQVKAPWTITTAADATYKLFDVIGGHYPNTNGLCNNTFIIAFTNNTPETVFERYKYDGTAWNGVCDQIAPTVTLSEPADGAEFRSPDLNFNFTVTDNYDGTMLNCSVWENITGTWRQNNSITMVAHDVKANISIPGLPEKIFSWNVRCFDQSENNQWASSNFTVKVNYNAPTITGGYFNQTVTNQSNTARFNVTVTDTYGINGVSVNVTYPNGTQATLPLVQSSSWYILNFAEWQLGTYNLTSILANDTFNYASLNSSLSIIFNVTASPPEPFSLLAPSNETVSSSLLPTLTWQQTVEQNFSNYTIRIQKSPSFNSPEFTYTTNEIGTTSKLVDFALDANQDYYWMVIAYDVFRNKRNSSGYFLYQTDTLKPAVTLSSPENNSFITTLHADFSYTVSDATGIRNCTLYHNMSGSFVRNATNTSVVNGTGNSFTIRVKEGIFSWEVGCNDTLGNSGMAGYNFTGTADLSGPASAQASPGNNTMITASNIINFTATASDAYANVTSCAVFANGERQDEFLNPGKDVPFTISAFLTNDNYTWYVNCTDTFGFVNLSGINNLEVRVNDSDPPFITLDYPPDGSYTSWTNMSFRYTPDDATGVANCTLYLDGQRNVTNTTVYNHVENSFNVTGIAEGYHAWTVECYDKTKDHYGANATPKNFTVDITSPAVALQSPPDQGYVASSAVSFVASANETNFEACSLYGNFSGSFAYDQTNTSPNNGSTGFSKALADDAYAWNVNCTDRAGQTTFAPANYLVKVDTTAPEGTNGLATPPSPVPYAPGQAYRFNITWTDRSGVAGASFEENLTGAAHNISVPPSGNDSYSYQLQDIAAGRYAYAWYANDTLGHEGRMAEQQYVISPAAGAIALTLNSSHANFTTSESKDVEAKATLTTPSQGTAVLLEDGAVAANGTSPQTVTFRIADPGTYNITALYQATQNYSAAQDTLFITVQDTLPPAVTPLYPPGGAHIGVLSFSFQYLATDGSALANCSLFINGTLNQTTPNPPRDVTLTFPVVLMPAMYVWRVDCYDAVGLLGTSGDREVTVENISILLSAVNTTNSTFHRGDVIPVTTNVTDYFGGTIMANVTTDIILANTSIPWWNATWRYRTPIGLNNPLETAQNGSVDVHLTFVQGRMTDCSKELRIIMNQSINMSPVAFLVLATDNQTYCDVRFNALEPANARNESSYTAYYNPAQGAAPDQAYAMAGIQVYRATVTTTGTSVTDTFPAVNLSRSLIIMSSATTSSAPNQHQVDFTTPASNQVTFNRYSGATAISISYQVIESTALNVQRSTVTFAAGDVGVNVTLPAPVNLSKAFAIIYGRASTGTASQSPRGYFRATLLDSTTLQIDRQTTGSAADVTWQVAEWDGAAVQSGSLATTVNQENVTISSVNLSRSFVVGSVSIANLTTTGTTIFRFNITNATGLWVARDLGGWTAYVTWYVVELPPSVKVQTGTKTVTAATVNVTIDKVDLLRTFNLHSLTAATASGTFAGAQVYSNLSNETKLTLEKRSASLTNLVVWYVVESPGLNGTQAGEQLLMNESVNETGLNGLVVMSWDSRNMTIANYSAVAVARRWQYSSAWNSTYFELGPDMTAPNMTLVSPENGHQQGAGLLNFTYIPDDPNLANCTLLLGPVGAMQDNRTNASPANGIANSFEGVFIDQGFFLWNVNCTDIDGNWGVAPSNFTLNVTGADLVVSSVWFGNESRVEGSNVTVFANVSNVGLTNASVPFLVGFFHATPGEALRQFGNNLTLSSLPAMAWSVVNASVALGMGNNSFVVSVDLADAVNETSEANNNLSANITITIYQFFFGNMSRVVKIEMGSAATFIGVPGNLSTMPANIYFADIDSHFDFGNLQALGRNTLGQATNNDFSDADANLNTSQYEDSIRQVWGWGSDSPVMVQAFNISGLEVQNVPVMNSTNSSDFKTGILWDTADDTSANNQFDTVDREDVVFVTRMNPGKTGTWGTYDYEVRIPANLRSYKTGSDAIIFYFEFS